MIHLWLRLVRRGETSRGQDKAYPLQFVIRKLRSSMIRFTGKPTSLEKPGKKVIRHLLKACSVQSNADTDSSRGRYVACRAKQGSAQDRDRSRRGEMNRICRCISDEG